MIARRSVLASAAALAAAAPAHAQQARPLVGFIGASSRQERFERAFVTGLRDLGFAQGRSVEIEFHWTAGSMEPVRSIASGLIERRVAAIVTGGGNVTMVVRALTSSVPIVFATAADPVADLLVASLARPGGNLTGLSLQSAELAPKLIEVLRDLVPRLARVAVFHSTASRMLAGRRAMVAAAAQSIGVAIQEVGFASAEELDRAFTEAAAADAGIMLRDFIAEANAGRIAELAARHRLPVIYEQAQLVRAGGLVSYAADFVDMHRRAAGYVARILRGASPAELPVEQPTRFELTINLKTAKVLGLTIPPSLLLRADEVIE